MAEEPLERIEREERERRARQKSLTPWLIVLAAIAVTLAGVLAYVWTGKKALVSELEDEKAELSEQMLALQADYADLNSEYESINSQLDTSREQVALLIERLQKTEATNRAQIRKYEKELGTLRTIMRGYIVQIDSLNTLNKQLTADAAAARREAAESRRVSEDLSRQVEDLSGRAAAGAVVKGHGLAVAAYNSHDKVTDRSSRAAYLMASVTLLENDYAERGPMMVYLRAKDPSGVLLLNSASTSFTFGGEPLQASASREVDYEGSEVDLSIYLKDVGEFTKGIYTVEAYTEKALLGKVELYLR